MSAHAYLPPSGAGAWVACAMWPMMNAAYPQDDTDESREGTAAHWCWTDVLETDAQYPVENSIAPNGVPVTEAMLDGAELYVRVVDNALNECGLTRDVLRVEQRVMMPMIHEHNDGTPDTSFYAPHLFRLYCFDYKFGHDYVDAFESWQCVNYVAGLIELVRERYGKTDDEIEVRICVVQPRNYDSDGPVRWWTVRGSDLRAMWNKLRSAAERAFAPMPVATTGAHCEHCPGRVHCNANQRQAYRAASLSRQSLPFDLPAQALATELLILQDAERDLAARISGLEAEADARIKRGETVPGFGMQASVGREKWTAAPDLVAGMGDALGVQVRKPALITPEQARKAGMPAEVVATIATRPAGGVKLVRMDPKALRKVFG